MVGMHLGASDNTLAVDDKSPGHRQFPGIIAIESREINAETVVHFLQFFRKGEDQTEFSSNVVICIVQYRKGEFMLFHDLFRIFIQLGGYGDD